MRKALKIILFMLFLFSLPLILPRYSHSAPNDCCTTDTDCETAFNETCTGTFYTCSNQGKRACVRPTSLACPSGQDCVNVPSQLLCDSEGGSFRTCSTEGAAQSGNCCVPQSGPVVTCDSLNGRCVPFVCSQGNPLFSSDCNPWPWRCCPNEPIPGQSCADLGGRCVPFECSQGDPLPSSDCRTFPSRCCPKGSQQDSGIQLKGLGCGENSQSVNTAIGCIPVTNTQNFTVWLVVWAAGMAGGVALVLIVYAGIMIITSAGNPQRVQAGKELLTAAIMGLILLLFGAYLLRFIGITILRIPF